MTSPVRAVAITIHVADPNWRDLPAALDQAAAAGADMAELPLPLLDLICGARVLADRVADVKRILADRPIGAVMHGHLGINLMEEPFRVGLHLDVLKANIEVAAELGCPHLVMHTGFVPMVQAAGIEHAYARQREHLARMGDVAQAHGVTLCVENVFDFAQARHTASPSRLAAELAAVGHPAVRATFDLSHGFLHCGVAGGDFLAEARALAPFARHLHVHDSFGRPKDQWTFTGSEDMAFGIGDLHLPIGWGAIPWDAVARDCAFPDGTVADVEVLHRYRSEFPAAVARTRAWAAGLRRADGLSRAAE